MAIKLNEICFVIMVLTYYWPAIGLLLACYWPAIGRLLAICRPYIGHILVLYRPELIAQFDLATYFTDLLRMLELYALPKIKFLQQ